jgi:hypothetical protein
MSAAVASYVAAALALGLATATVGGDVVGAAEGPAAATPGADAGSIAEAKSEAAPAKPATRRAHRKGVCERLDAASTPACADQLPKAPVAAPKPATPATMPPPPPTADRPPASPKPVPAKRPSAKTSLAEPARPKLVSATHAGRPRGAKHAATAAHGPPAGAWQMALGAVHRRPLLAGGAGGAAVLLLAAGAWGTAGRLRRRPRTVGAARATPPTAFRRDILLKDAAGRDWRSPGAALTPGVVAGSGAGSQLRLTGDGVAPRHIMLWVCDGRLLARRLADPVFLNDRLLKDATPEIVSTGDRLRLGRADFTIMID